ncbi:DUF6090 family protein [Psychroserpens sp. AS72]|uniref:DUF6090 family protein n=1 Tax=Psychroserpens sp. AS72 TaxID=3135775 RepID=UPI00317ED26A
MIKFFRNIRQKTLNENKFGKYLTYAIGEIILVVIGILIALSINNWNNNKQLRSTEHVYLLSLQTEFKTNLKKINDCIIENEARINSVEKMLTLFDVDVSDTTSDKTISDIMFSIFGGEATYQPSKGVLTDIISSGNLNLIQNEHLRQSLASFESTLVFLKLQENNIRSSKEKMQNLLNKNGSVRKVLIHRGINFEHPSISDTANNKNLFSLIEFENELLNYYLTTKATNGPRFFGGIKEHIEQILVEIDAELKK